MPLEMESGSTLDNQKKAQITVKAIEAANQDFPIRKSGYKEKSPEDVFWLQVYDTEILRRYPRR